MEVTESDTSNRTLLAVALLSAAMLAVELALTRLFALAQFYHFAFMIVSLALLGIGVSGSLLSSWPRLGRHPTLLAAGFGVSALLAFASLDVVPFDSYAIAWDRRQVAFLVITFVAACVPFVFGGLVIGAELAKRPRQAYRTYAANLVGSAFGCLAVLPAVALMGAEGTLLAAAAASFVAAPLLQRSDHLGTRVTQVALLATAVAMMSLAAVRPPWIDVQLSPYKPLRQALRAPGAYLDASRWGLSGRVDVVSSAAIHVLPGLSQNAPLTEPPHQLGIAVNGDDLAPITLLSPDDPLAMVLASNVPEGAATTLRPGGSWLVLEPAGGWPVLMALAGGARHVTAIETDAQRAQLLQDRYSAATGGLFDDERVQLRVGNARTALSRDNARYDVIAIGLSDAFHPVTSGAYSLTEDYRYTTETFAALLEHLQPGGILVLTRWLQSPPTESLRALATLSAALRTVGIDEPRDQLVAFRSLRTMTFLVSLDPWLAADLDTLRSFVSDRGYDMVWAPDIDAGETNRHARLPQPLYFESFERLLADPGGFLETYRYDVRPVTDDRPFFFHYFRLGQTPDVLQQLGATWQPFGGSGYLVLVALLALALALSAVVVGAPLLIGTARRAVLSAPPAARLDAILYFAALGLGYLLVLIPLSQRFVLLLDQPVVALAVVFAAALLFSGIGSLTAPRWRLDVALGVLVIVVALTPLLLGGLYSVAMAWPLWARLIAAALCLAPLGLLMGVPFASGLALLEVRSPGLTAWAWAINGSASVIAGIVAVMIALSWGFTLVIWTGALAYLLALAVARRMISATAARSPTRA